MITLYTYNMQTTRGFKITPDIRREIERIVDERIREVHVIREDFSELKAIVRELLESQKQSETRLTSIERTIEKLALAQKSTQETIGELAQAQKQAEVRLTRVEKAVEELAQAQKQTEQEIAKLTGAIREVRHELGGLSRSVSYAFENEAFRMLPVLLKNKYSLQIIEKFIRAEIAGKEINIFGRAKKDGQEVLIVGEAKLRLDDRKDKIDDIFDEIDEKVEAVRKEYGAVPIVRILVTHFATKAILKKAQERGIIVIQSFEW
ncbi:MAG: hypothetical protein N2513_10445 [Deltaproteobacteria bacterium]|nr:hypothetical protein [Deltaproteobacteria bacterium]